MEAPSPRPRRLAGILFVLLAGIWIALRFVPVTGPPDEATRIAVAAVSVDPSLESGRLRILGLPPAGVPPSAPARAARRALLARTEAIDADLARRAAGLAGRLEDFEDGAVALRLAGLATPFHDHDAQRLTEARAGAQEKPWLALIAISDVLAARLEEPPSGGEIEDGVRRRELTRTFRETRDWLGAAEAEASAALESYRRESLAAASPRPDAFRRQGPGRLLEAGLAAWLAVTLAAWRRPRHPTDLAVQLAGAAVASLAGLLAFEGSPLLPLDERGVTPAFLPLSFAIGWGVSRLSGNRTAAPAAPGPAPAGAAAPAPPVPRPAADPPGNPREAPDPGLRQIAQDVLAAEERHASSRGRTDRPAAPCSEVEVEEDPVVGPGRRAFGPPGGPSTARPAGPRVPPPEPDPPPPEPPPRTSPAPERLPFFRRRR